MHEKLLRNTAQFIAENHLLCKENKPVLVGLSGGPDSVALLSVLLKLGYNCIAAHVNFHLRSEESNREEQFVRKLANDLQTPIHIIDFQTFEYAKKEGISIEMAARKLRYGWFEKLAVQTSAQAIAVGHHLDDNLETILLNLIRGTGLRGLTGMPVRNGLIVRPFLGSSRTEILNYLQSEQLDYVTDSSNASTEIMRNKIRHEVLPLLESMNPAFREKLSETRHYLSQSDNLIANFIEKWKTKGYLVQGDQIKLDISRIESFPEPELLLFELLSPFGFNSAQITDARGLLQSHSGKMLVSETYTLLKDRDFIILSPNSNTNKTESWLIQPNEVPQNPAGLKINIFERYSGFEFSRDKKLIHLDADKLSFPLILKRAKPGDYFYPQGMKMQKKKLSDFLINAKLSRFEKENIYILESDGQIVWLVGHRIDERFCIRPETSKIAELSIKHEHYE
jgi:tRNA(Ile)-lysidine synthase